MAKGGAIDRGLKELEQYVRGRTVQPGMFSVLDEVIADAPFETNSVEQWQKYLQPGRMVKREGVQFPLRKEELDWSFNRLKFPDSSAKLSKEELRQSIAGSRHQFELSVAKEIQDYGKVPGVPPVDTNPVPQRWKDLFARYGELPPLGEQTNYLDENTIEGSIHDMGSPRYGTEYAGDTDSRLFHYSPGATYEESVTNMPGIERDSHFDRDTLSWSRTTTHSTGPEGSELNIGDTESLVTSPNKKIRLVEEIQSDLHSAAAEKMFVDPVTNMRYSEYQANNTRYLSQELRDRLVPERFGYIDAEANAEIETLTKRLEEIDARRAELAISPGGLSEELRQLTMKSEKLGNKLDSYNDRIQDAPFKNPAKYAGLELRKQLLNAVENDEDYLAIVRGRDQIERYEQGMDERRAAGMTEMYDKIYVSELNKLAKRYGAKITEVAVPLRTNRDVRPIAMAARGMESIGEFGDEVKADMEEATELREVLGSLSDYYDAISYVEKEMEGNIAYIDPGGNEDALKILKNKLVGVKQTVENFFDRASAADEEGIAEYQVAMAELANITDEFSNMYDGYELFFGAKGGNLLKDFPAIELTPEVKEKIRRVGVPQFARGGVVRMQHGGLSAFSGLRRRDAPISEAEYEQVMTGLSESEDERVLQEKMGTLKYWKDVPMHLVSTIAARLKQHNPETGETRWLGDAPVPDIELVYRGLMTMEEWLAEKEAADRYNEENRDFRSTWVDDIKSMAVLPAMAGNLAGEFLGIGPGSLNPEDHGAFAYPEFAVEAANRVGTVERETQQALSLEDPTGFPQHLAGGLGIMATQVPVPGSPLKGALTTAVERVPQSVKMAMKPITVPVGAALEFANPVVDPSLKNYAAGSLFGGALGSFLEPSGEAARETEQEESSLMAEQIDALVTEQWDETPVETKLQVLMSPFGERAWGQLDADQQAEMIQELRDRGLLEDDVPAEAEEPQAEMAKGGYIKDLVKLRGNVIDAEKLFEKKKKFDPMDPTTIEAVSTEYLPPTPEFLAWFDDFNAKLDAKNAERDELVKKTKFLYKKGDIVMGDKFRHQILFKDVNKNGEPFYRVRNLDEDAEYDLKEKNIRGKFGNLQGVPPQEPSTSEVGLTAYNTVERILTEYGEPGRDWSNLRIVEDPSHPGVYAAMDASDDIDPDFLEGFIIDTNVENPMDMVEEVEFPSWPPKPRKFARGGQVSSALVELRRIAEKAMRERIEYRKTGKMPTTDFIAESSKLTGIEDPFAPADENGVILGPFNDNIPADYYPKDKVAAEMRKLYRAIEDLGPRTAEAKAGLPFIEKLPKKAKLGDMLAVSKKIGAAEEVEWEQNVELAQKERSAKELERWGPELIGNPEKLELAGKQIVDDIWRANEKHITKQMRDIAEQAIRDPGVMQDLDEWLFFEPVIAAPKGGDKYDEFMGTFGNFGAEVTSIHNMWLKALGNDFKFKRIVKRLKEIEEGGL